MSDASAGTVPAWADVLEDSTVPKVGSQLYTTKRYWDHRFEDEAHHEWLASYADIRERLAALVPDKAARILLVGCGNSSLPADMVADGYSNVIASDYSEVVVEKMAARQAAMSPQLAWRVEDMLHLTLDAKSVDVVFDKAAMDAVLAHGADVWDPPADLLATADTIMAESHRVLKAGGSYLQLSFSQPHFRRQYLLQHQEARWSDLKKYDVNVGFGYFMYHLVAR